MSYEDIMENWPELQLEMMIDRFNEEMADALSKSIIEVSF